MHFDEGVGLRGIFTMFPESFIYEKYETML
jgi:hypothetical protein